MKTKKERDYCPSLFATARSLGGHGFGSRRGDIHRNLALLRGLEPGDGLLARLVLGSTQIDERLAALARLALRLAVLVLHADQNRLVALHIGVQVIDHGQLADAGVGGIRLFTGETTIRPHDLALGTTDTTLFRLAVLLAHFVFPFGF